MNHDEALELSKRVRRDANQPVAVKIGRTNGKHVLHVYAPEARRSQNIPNLGEWLIHPLNKNVKPTRARKPRNADRDLADEATVAAGLNTTYEPED